MTTRNTRNNLDSRDEFILMIITAFIPVVTLGSMFV